MEFHDKIIESASRLEEFPNLGRWYIRFLILEAESYSLRSIWKICILFKNIVFYNIGIIKIIQ